MSIPDFAVRDVRLSSGQCLTVHLVAGAVVHVEQGRIALTAAPRWLAEQVSQAGCDLRAGGVWVVDASGWHSLAAHAPAQLRIVAPAARLGLWRLIKSRFGRSGFLLGNSRPPDTKAAEPSVPHATSQ